MTVVSRMPYRNADQMGKTRNAYRESSVRLWCTGAAEYQV